MDAGPANNVVVEELLGLRDAGLDAGVDAGPEDAGPPRDPFTGPQGDSRCRLLWGPARVPFNGPGALRARAGRLEMIVHEHGQPRTHRVGYGKPPARPVVPPPLAERGVSSVGFPGCALADHTVYCLGPEGRVIRTALAGGASKEVARARPSELLAAAAMGPEHSVVAFLERRLAPGGELMLEAYAVLDDNEALRISEPGSGATFVTLTSLSDDAVLALSIDARTAMSPVHARVLTRRGKELVLSPDEVVFVGGSERGGAAALATFPGGERAAFLPMPSGVRDYGLVGLALPDPLRIDLPAETYAYAAGLDGARVASAPAGNKVYVALTRKKREGVDAPAVLELAEAHADGKVTPLGVVAEGVPMLDLDMVGDEHGALWLLYGDARGSLLERRLCP